jgi:hypothetical protein
VLLGSHATVSTQPPELSSELWVLTIQKPQDTLNTSRVCGEDALERTLGLWSVGGYLDLTLLTPALHPVAQLGGHHCTSVHRPSLLSGKEEESGAYIATSRCNAAPRTRALTHPHHSLTLTGDSRDRTHPTRARWTAPAAPTPWPPS